jgi:hypothetical protein
MLSKEAMMKYAAEEWASREADIRASVEKKCIKKGLSLEETAKKIEKRVKEYKDSFKASQPARLALYQIYYLVLKSGYNKKTADIALNIIPERVRDYEELKKLAHRVRALVDQKASDDEMKKLLDSCWVRHSTAKELELQTQEIRKQTEAERQRAETARQRAEADAKETLKLQQRIKELEEQSQNNSVVNNQGSESPLLKRKNENSPEFKYGIPDEHKSNIDSPESKRPRM